MSAQKGSPTIVGYAPSRAHAKRALVSGTFDERTCGEARASTARTQIGLDRITTNGQGKKEGIVAPSTSNRMWETFALLDLGDHGLAAARNDPRRVGLIELTDRMRWVPQAGEGWDVRIDAIKITSAKGFLGFAYTGVEMELPVLGRLRIRGLGYEPGLIAANDQRIHGGAYASGRLRKQLLRRGAQDCSTPERSEDGDFK